MRLLVALLLGIAVGLVAAPQTVVERPIRHYYPAVGRCTEQAIRERADSLRLRIDKNP